MCSLHSIHTDNTHIHIRFTTVFLCVCMCLFFLRIVIAVIVVAVAVAVFCFFSYTLIFEYMHRFLFLLLQRRKNCFDFGFLFRSVCLSVCLPAAGDSIGSNWIQFQSKRADVELTLTTLYVCAFLSDLFFPFCFVVTLFHFHLSCSLIRIDMHICLCLWMLHFRRMHFCRSPDNTISPPFSLFSSFDFLLIRSISF